MRVLLKQRVSFQKKVYFGDVDIDVAKLTPAEVKYLHKLIANGRALEPKSLPVETISEAERSKRLSERLLKEVRQPRPPIKDQNSLPEGVNKAEESGEGESSDESQADESDAEESSAEADESEESGDDADSSDAESKPSTAKKAKKKKRRG